MMRTGIGEVCKSAAIDKVKENLLLLDNAMSIEADEVTPQWVGFAGGLDGKWR